MDTIQCAVILAKLKRFEWEIERRLALGDRYNRLFDDHGIERVVQRPDRTSVFAQYTIFTEDRASVEQALQAAGIPTAVHYPAPLSHQPAYRGISKFGPLPNSELASKRVLSLPMHAYLDEVVQDQIVAEVAAALAKNPSRIASEQY